MSEKNYCTVCGETLVLNGLNKIVQDLIVELAGLSHMDLLDIGVNTHEEIDIHIGDDTIHFIQSEIDHVNLLNKGVKTHSEIDTHINTSNIHFEKSEISHNDLLDKGTKLHSEIDTHINNNGLHNQIISMSGILGNNGFVEEYSYGYGLKVLFSDVDASICVSFYVKDGGTFKIIISHRGDGNNSGKTANGSIECYYFVDNESITNLINENANLPLANTLIGKIYKHGTTVTVPNESWVNVNWQKTNNAGGASGNMMIHSVVLERQ